MLSLEQQFKILESLQNKGFLAADKSAEIKDDLKNGKISDLFDYARQEKMVKNEEWAQAIAEVANLPYQDLTHLKAVAEDLKMIPEELARNYQLTIFERKENLIKVGLCDPTDLKAQEVVDYLAREKNLKVEYYIISTESLNNILKQYSGLTSEVSEALDVAKGKMEEEKKEETKKEDLEELTEAVKSAPVAKMVSVILKHAVDGRASDVHIEPFSDSCRVRYRIDGELITSLVLPKYIHAALVSRIKVLANLKIDETRIPQDGRIRLNILGNNVDFRVSTLPLYENEKVVMRILDTSSGALTLEQLGFEGRNLEVIEENIQKPHGMFLVTGPTGSGKSTTLYSVLNILNKEEVNIVTLEDPVEYYLTGINQSQIRPEVGLTFATGLRSILRQDPDVIMVGEIRDNETAELAIHAALTGHIVLSTLHTNDSFGAIPRLTDMKVEPFLIASTLNVIVAQRLVRKVCKECRQEIKIPEKMKEEVLAQVKNISPAGVKEDLRDVLAKAVKGEIKFFAGKGCPVCNKTGYKGRVGIVEVFSNTDNLKELIATNRMDDKSLTEEAKAQNMITLQQDGILKAMRGVTTIEEIMRATRE